MNEFLKSIGQIHESTKWLKENNYVSHPISCKDFELRLITEAIGDGNLIDLGADGSFVLHNAVIKGIKGRKVGIDLAEVTGDNKAEGVEYFQGDLMRTPFEDGSFDTIVSASVIEHEVDFNLLAKECSRLLTPNGNLFISFDFWPEKVNTEGLTLYGLKWNILDTKDFLGLIEAFRNNGLSITGETDWGVEDMVINDRYCSPFKNISYTFGIFKFIKK